MRAPVLFNGEDTTHVAVRDRNVGFVFQHYAPVWPHDHFRKRGLWPCVCVPRPPARLKPPFAPRSPSCSSWSSSTGLPTGIRISSLGASANALRWLVPWLSSPKVLLLDEPFGALDAKVRKELRRWLRRLHDEMHITSVFVTHDQEEAMEVADRIVVMNQGRIEQQGTPDQVYDHPASPFVLQFLGDVNLFTGGIMRRARPRLLRRHRPM